MILAISFYKISRESHADNLRQLFEPEILERHEQQTCRAGREEGETAVPDRCRRGAPPVET